MRVGANEFDLDGYLLNGYDYDLQMWIKDGVVVNCGHAPEMDCGCNGRKYQGMSLESARELARGESPEDDMERARRLPGSVGQADPEYQSRLDAARVTAEFKSAIQPRKPQRDPGDLPLFGGERQGGLF